MVDVLRVLGGLVGTARIAMVVVAMVVVDTDARVKVGIAALDK